MRIALATDTFAPQVNGVTTVLLRMVESLRAEGNAVAMVAPSYPQGDPPARTPELRLPSAGFPPYPEIRLSLPRAGRVARFLDEFGPDVVHVPTEGPIGLMARRYALRRDVPLVTSYHTQFPQYARHYGMPALEPLVWRWMEWFHGPARLTHTPGDAVRDELKAHGIRNTVVWGRGVDTSHFHPDKRDRAWKRRLDLDEHATLVLHVGRLAPEKNLDVLAAAWRMAAGALGGRAAFVVAGAGPRADALMAAAPFAHRLGFLDRDALATLFASADLCVLPSHTETCGLVALEALASGVPVIAADAGGFRESVVNGVNGFLVAPNDSPGFAARIIELAINAARRRELAAQARASTLERDIAAENAELVRHYSELAGVSPAMPVAPVPPSQATCAA